MSTYWFAENKRYPVTLVLEDIKTGVQSNCIFEILFLNGEALLVPTGTDKTLITTSTNKVEISEGNKLAGMLPSGKKLVTLDTSKVPAGIAVISIKDGSVDKPATGLVSNKTKSEGAGIPDSIATDQAAPS